MMLLLMMMMGVAVMMVVEVRRLRRHSCGVAVPATSIGLDVQQWEQRDAVVVEDINGYRRCRRRSLVVGGVLVVAGGR